MPRFASLVVASILAVALTGGCAAPVTMPVWQRSVETYVREEAGNDPLALRDVTWKDNQRGFKVFNAPDPRSSTDANGLLLGHRIVGGKPWFLFLVGIVDEQKVEEIRLAALNVAGERYTWRVAPPDKQALRAYRQYNRALFEQRFPDRRSVAPEYMGFPRDADVFEVAVEDPTVRVTHPQSGAQWHLDVLASEQE